MCDLDFNDIQSLKGYGSEGFHSISELQRLRCNVVPEVRGVYIVVYPFKLKPLFEDKSIGGHFKGKNPTVDREILKNKWIENTKVIYIGEAGGGGNNATLQSRIWCYMRCGMKEPVEHWGGRYIWQLADPNSLQIFWKPVLGVNPREVEIEVIIKFKAQYNNRLPFANLRH